MSHALINKKVYENKRNTLHYISAKRLEDPEIMIFVKYKERIWDRQVLDIGCGAGRTTGFLKNFTRYYMGIDYSSAMIELCKKRFEDIQFSRCDVRDMGIFENNKFDFILFSFNGLDHVGDNEDRQMGLREIHRVLGEDGIFVFSSHNRNYRNAITHPNIRFALNPITQIRNLRRYVRCRNNHLRNKKYQYFGTEYAIINGMSHDYGVLTYCMDKENQTAQIREAGFELMEMYDRGGNALALDDDDSNSAWIHYVTRKKRVNR